MNENNDSENELVSKTQRKLEATALQQLGMELGTLKSAQLQQLALPESLLAALAEYKRLPNSHGAKRRQLQFIGKLMRHCDYDQLRKDIDRLRDTRRRKSSTKNSATVWLEKLIDGGDEEISSFMTNYPQCNRQQLRQLLREYKRGNIDKQAAITSRITALIQQQVS